MLGYTSILRAALLVACAAILEVTLTPLLTFGWVGPRFLVLSVVVAVMGMRDLQALLLGFFGGILADALSGGIFGVGALGGVCTAVIATRMGDTHRKGEARLILALAAAVAVYDLLNFFAVILTAQNVPSFVRYIFGGVVPDVLLNCLLAYLVGAWLLKLITPKKERWA